MKHYCITGGIGAGKSYVSKMLRERSITVFDSDQSAKRITANDLNIREKIIRLVGPEAYTDGIYNKAAVTKFLLHSEENKQALNAIIHPAVIDDYYASGAEWMECAIVYEAHLEKFFDQIVCVTAPEDVRVKRIMQRNNVEEEVARKWISIQTPQDTIAEKADFTIINDGITPLDEQIDKLLMQLK